MERSELKSRIPYGYCKRIAQKAGVSKHSVSKYLKGKTNSYKVEKAILEVIAELSQEKQQLLAKIN